MVKEALEKKVVWPWVAPNEDESAKRKNLLKSKGFKEWTNPKAKGPQKKWTIRYGIEPKTGTLLSIFIWDTIFMIFFQTHQDSLAVIPMAHPQPLTKRVKMKTKTRKTKYKLTKSHYYLVHT